MNAQVTIETINPKLASEWLENKWDEQRPLRPNHVLKLSAEMKNGKFKLSWDAITLIKGRLGNGQHRLSAVVESGKSAQFIVMRSNDEELFKIGDAGVGRSVADVLGDVPYSKAIASSARLVLAYDGKFMSPSGPNINMVSQKGKEPLTRSRLLDYIAKHQVLLSEQSSFVYALYGQTRIVGTTVSTALLHIVSRKHPELAKQFITNVYLGESLDASKDFRDRMIRQMGTKSRLRQEYVFALMIKAWKSFKNGTRPGTLKMVDGEDFPEVA